MSDLDAELRGLVVGLEHPFFDLIERTAEHVRQFEQHSLWETIVQHLDDLIAAGRALKTERASLLADRDAQKARADKAEADLATLQAQVASDEQKAADAQGDLEAEVTAEGAANGAGASGAAAISTTVTAPVPAQSTTLPVTPTDAGTIASAVSAASAAGSPVAVTGDNIAPGATVVSVDPAASTITISDPTTAAHAGDGSEQVVVTPLAVPAAG